MSRSFKSLFAAFALFVVASTQVFGLVQGYICVCTGEQVIAATEHCHHTHPCDGTTDSEGHEHSSPASHHAPNRVELEASPLAKHPAPPEPLMAEIPVMLQIFDVRPVLQLSTLSPGIEMPPFAGSPPLSQVVAKCMVLLV